MISCYNCSNEVDKNQLPTFNPIDVDENTIFLVNRKDDDVHKIYAIDTKKNKKIYTYDFKRKVVYDLMFDASFDMNPYIILLSGEALKLDVKSGKLKRFDVKYTPEVLSVIDNKLWITPSGVGLKDTPKDYFTYDVKTDKSEYITIPEGMFWGSWMNIDNKHYLPLDINANKPKIYNLTTGKILEDNLFNKEYYGCSFEGKQYLNAWYYNTNYDLICDLYFINSFEPTINYNFLFSTDPKYSFSKMFEDVNYIYMINRNDITKVNKNNSFKVEKKVTFDNKSSGGSLGFYHKNGYIWLTSEENDGAYKVNMDDLSYEIIK